MINQKYTDIVKSDDGLIIHDVYHGFKEDYLVLQTLIIKHKPKSMLEIGTNTGNGVRCIHHAMSQYMKEPSVFSLDLDYETMCQNSAQYPLDADGNDRVGSDARHISYIQLRGDSLTFNYREYPCEGYYIDGEHTTIHAKQETFLILSCKPKIIIYHDTDMPEVMDGILQGIAIHPEGKKYEMYRVVDTRISYLIRK